MPSSQQINFSALVVFISAYKHSAILKTKNRLMLQSGPYPCTVVGVQYINGDFVYPG